MKIFSPASVGLFYGKIPKYKNLFSKYGQLATTKTVYGVRTGRDLSCPFRNPDHPTKIKTKNHADRLNLKGTSNFKLACAEPVEVYRGHPTKIKTKIITVSE